MSDTPEDRQERGQGSLSRLYSETVRAQREFFGKGPTQGRPMVASTPLVRPRRGRVLAGVCAGLARRFEVQPRRVRLLFVLSCLLPGPQILLYVALWIILPAE
jgi:phage shock protein PspC (stress-responsive transcriptional regulator)